MKQVFEKDLEIYDVFESPNGNLFLKIDCNYSIPLGPKTSDPLDLEDIDFGLGYVKSSIITPIKKVGSIKFK